MLRTAKEQYAIQYKLCKLIVIHRDYVEHKKEKKKNISPEGMLLTVFRYQIGWILQNVTFPFVRTFFKFISGVLVIDITYHISSRICKQ